MPTAAAQCRPNPAKPCLPAPPLGSDIGCNYARHHHQRQPGAGRQPCLPPLPAAGPAAAPLPQVGRLAGMGYKQNDPCMAGRLRQEGGRQWFTQHLHSLCVRLHAANCRRSEELQLPHLVAFSCLALARFELLHPQSPPAAADASSGGGAGSSSSAEPPCSSSVAVAGAARDVAHLHFATRLAAAAPAAPPASSGTSSARVLRGVTDLFTAMPPMFAPRMQGEPGWHRMWGGPGRALQRAGCGQQLLGPCNWACSSGNDTRQC